MIDPRNIIDASANTRVDANTRNISYMKDGKVFATGTTVMSPDGRTYTLTGTRADGQQFNYILVHDKQ